MQTNPRIVPVACAIIEHHYRYLICQRAAHKENPGLWEFPGGKLIDGESLKSCIEREILEELTLKSTALAFLASSETLVSNGAGEEQIIRLYALKVQLGEEPLREKLKDHSDFKWVAFERLCDYALTKPDLALLHSLDPHLSKEREIAHLDSWSMARLYGIFYAIFGTVMGIYMIFSSQLGLPADGQASKFYRFAAVILMPFINFGVGAVFGCLFAFFYNLMGLLVGGVKMRFR